MNNWMRYGLHHGPSDRISDSEVDRRVGMAKLRAEETTLRMNGIKCYRCKSYLKHSDDKPNFCTECFKWIEINIDSIVVCNDYKDLFNKRKKEL